MCVTSNHVQLHRDYTALCVAARQVADEWIEALVDSMLDPVT